MNSLGMELTTKIPGFVIREAVSDDVALILSFIRELADYEKLSHEVVATEEMLRKTLFGGRKAAEVLIGYYHNEPACFALFFHNYSTFLGKPGLYLEDLYVKPHFRGKGFGKMMFCYLASVARQRDCGRLEWWVLDWNARAIDFYRSMGAQPMDGWTVQRLEGETLAKLASSFM